ncbi:MAG: helix-turn-helix transcriptional regulator [bacterium]
MIISSPFLYMMNQRLNKARHLLSSTSLSIKEIAEAVGYDNPLYFSRVFTTQMNITPSRYRALNIES